MMKQVFLRAFGNYDADVVSAECGLDCSGEPSVAQQQFAEECDINTIVRRFGLTGELPNGIAMPVSGDFVGVSDFHAALNVVREAEAAFMELPGHIRARFNHDPGKVVEFLNDDKNRSEAIDLGLVAKPLEKTRDVVQAVDELKASLSLTSKPSA